MPSSPMVLQLLAVEVDGWPGLNQAVRVELNAERTVLVGRNGAGKSVVLAAMVQGAALALSPAAGRRRQFPAIGRPAAFRCDVGTPDSVHYSYEYALSFVVDETEEPSSITGRQGLRVVWTERCMVPGGSSDLWNIGDEGLTVAGRGDKIKLPPGCGLLSVGRELLPEIAKDLPVLLSGFDLVGAGVPRPVATNRRSVFLQGIVRGDAPQADAPPAPRRRLKRPVQPDAVNHALSWRVSETGANDRVEQLAEELARIYQRSPKTFEEFKAVLGRLKLVKDVRFHQFEIESDETSRMGVFTFDHVNVGLLSDGTLRVIEIILHVLRPSTRVLCIEEPETAVHPGLLQRVLSELSAYAHDRQIVVSTHSPYVVNWGNPTDLRLVERIEGTTSVRSLGEAEVQNIENYLAEDQMLDGYVFSQDLEGDE